MFDHSPGGGSDMLQCRPTIHSDNGRAPRATSPRERSSAVEVHVRAVCGLRHSAVTCQLIVGNFEQILTAHGTAASKLSPPNRRRRGEHSARIHDIWPSKMTA